MIQVLADDADKTLKGGVMEPEYTQPDDSEFDVDLEIQIAEDMQRMRAERRKELRK